jgi:hypothetical protein
MARYELSQDIFVIIPYDTTTHLQGESRLPMFTPIR